MYFFNSSKYKLISPPQVQFHVPPTEVAIIIKIHFPLHIYAFIDFQVFTFHIFCIYM